MAQHDYIIANQSGSSFRSDLNNGLAAIVSQNSGAAQPSTTYAYQWWADTTTGLLKIRNAANNAWITVGTLADTNLGLAPLASPTFTGTVTIPAGASISGFAPLASPTLTGTPAAPTASAGNSTTQIATTAFVTTGGAPGAVMFFAQNSAPTGWLKANGAAISRTTYAALFAAIGTTFGVGDGSTTFGVPDLRGEFPRGWDDGRGIDSGRGIGTAQAQDHQSHTHTVTDPGHQHNIQYYQSTGGGEAAASAQILNSAIGNTVSATTGITISNTGGTETRPRNIALLACIKF